MDCDFNHARHKRVIGVTGGIGAGKSVVCRVLALRGLPLYDCDSRAKALMDASAELKAGLTEILGSEILDDCGALNRARMAELIFADESMRLRVNELVHALVRDDIRAWVLSQASDTVVVESAIMHQAGLEADVSEIWLVEAPRELRASRAMERSRMSREQALARMDSQAAEYQNLCSQKVRTLTNDGLTPLLPQIDNLLKTPLKL